ncbi:MAG: type II toxin-antitoxin system HicB family antitoxin [Chloroflexota bacterium]
MLKYKNYIGVVEYDVEGKIFTGEVVGLRDMVTFEGRTPEELEDSFRQSVDFYLELCARDNVSPQKPFSGRFNVRLDPELHRQVALRAAQEKISLNEWVIHTLQESVR